MLTSGARIRIRTALASGVGFDEWFVDDVVIGCDADGDLLPNYKEQKVYFTDANVADTDNDGVDDGAEILAGTDPLDPASN